MQHSSDRAHILIVDDNPADIELTREVLDAGCVDVDVSFATDGQEAMAYLEGCADTGRSVPHMVLLDINLPRLSGIGVLTAMRKHPALTGVPVIMLSASASQSDVDDSYALGANSYMSKCDALDEAQSKMDSLLAFWFSTARLPQVKLQ